MKINNFNSLKCTFFELPNIQPNNNPGLGLLNLIGFLEKKKIKCEFFDLSYQIFKLFLDESILNCLFKNTKKQINNFFDLSILRYIEKKYAYKGIYKYPSILRKYYLYFLVFNLDRLYINFSSMLFPKQNKTKSNFIKKEFPNNLINDAFLPFLVNKRKINRNLQEIFIENTPFKDFILDSVSKSEVIGFSIKYPAQMLSFHKIAKMIKKKFPEKKIIVGGYYITFLAHTKKIKPSLFKYIDYLVLDYGEEAVYKLIKYLEGKEKIENVPNLMYLKNNLVISTKKKSSMGLNKIPSPAYNHLNLDFYKRKRIYYETNRGCAWGKCAFCTFINTKKNHSMKAKKASKIVDDLIELKKNTKVNHFWLVNDCLPVNLAVKISHEILKKKANIKWQTNIRFEEELDFQTLKLLHDAGCTFLKFGLESGNQRVNQLINKGIKLESASRIIKDCKKLGIQSLLHVIVGFPNESLKESFDTFKFIKKHIKYVDIIMVNKFFLYPLSRIYKHPSQYGIKRIVPDKKNEFTTVKNNLYRKYLIGLLLWFYTNRFNKKYKNIDVRSNFII